VCLVVSSEAGKDWILHVGLVSAVRVAAKASFMVPGWNNLEVLFWR